MYMYMYICINEYMRIYTYLFIYTPVSARAFEYTDYTSKDG